jgi:hypothetical protein
VSPNLGRSPIIFFKHFNSDICTRRLNFVGGRNETLFNDIVFHGIRIRIRMLLSNRGHTRGKVITVIHKQ